MYDIYYDKPHDDQGSYNQRYGGINNHLQFLNHDYYYQGSERLRANPAGYGNPFAEHLPTTSSRNSYIRPTSPNNGRSSKPATGWGELPLTYNLSGYSQQALTKQVEQMTYEMPRAHQYAHPSLRSYTSPLNRHGKTTAASRAVGGIAPQFLKVFGDIPNALLGTRIVLDCVLLGMPRPRVLWLFNGVRIAFTDDDIKIDDTADLCRLTISPLSHYHYGTYTVVAENELGRAVTHARVSPPIRQT